MSLLNPLRNIDAAILQRNDVDLAYWYYFLVALSLIKIHKPYSRNHYELLSCNWKM